MCVWAFFVYGPAEQIPYSCEVRMDKFKERQSETVLDATIVVSQESQKGMVIGKGGAKIKEVGIKARIVSLSRQPARESKKGQEERRDRTGSRYYNKGDRASKQHVIREGRA